MLYKGGKEDEDEDDDDDDEEEDDKDEDDDDDDGGGSKRDKASMTKAAINRFPTNPGAFLTNTGTLCILCLHKRITL